MSAAKPQVTEAELHAYLDGELNPTRVEAVEAHFLKDDDDALRFGAYRRQSDLMRRVYGKLDAQPLGEAMLPATAPEAAPTPRRSTRFWPILAVLLLLGLAGVAGWFAHIEYLARFSGAPASIQAEALAAHEISLSDRPAALEVMGGAAASILEWLSRAFGFGAQTPTLQEQGVEIVAGQLVPSPTGVAAHLSLRDAAGDQLSFYVRPGGSERLTSFRTPAGSSVPMVVWESSGTSLALVGELPEADLRTFAGALQRSLVDPAPRSDDP